MCISLALLITFLFLSAQPEMQPRSNLMIEYTYIRQELDVAGKEGFKIEQYHNTYFSEIRKQLLLHKPQIVHFSGHGSKTSELIFKNEKGVEEAVPSDALSELFKILGKDIHLVFLNGCYSQEQAEAIAKHVDCVIGMPRSVISEDGAIQFAKSFYSTLGFGRSVQDAFDLAVHDLRYLSIPSEVIPQILKKDGIDPSKMFINGKALPDKDSPKPQPLCDQLESLKQNHQKLLMQQITINEFFKVIADSIYKFLSDSNNKKKIGEVNSNALNLLLINLSNKVNEYDNLNQLGNNVQANIVRNESMNVAQRLIDKLEDICK